MNSAVATSRIDPQPHVPDYRDAKIVERPSPDASEDIWDDYLHNRDNPAGVTKDLWYHESGCNSWLVVTRNTVTHEVLSADLASGIKGELT